MISEREKIFRKKQKEYWLNRAIQIEALTQENIEKMNKKVLTSLRDSEKKIKKDIAELYGKFAIDNKIDIAEARKMLNNNEFKEWRMNIEEYMKEYKITGNKELWREIEVLTMRKRISRLESMQGQVKAELLVYGVKAEKVMKEGFGEIYKNSYYQNMYDLQNENGILFDFATVDIPKLENVLRYKNAGKNFSTRIWESTQRIATRINKDLSQGFSTVIDYNKISKNIEKDFKVAKHEADRLVRTESNFYMNQGTLHSYKEAEILKYIYEATLDKRTSTICRELDQNIFEVSQAMPGTNYPPMHPNCRSTTIPDLDVDYSKRIARNKENVNIIVEGDLKYNQWQNYIDTGELPKKIVKEKINKEEAEKFTEKFTDKVYAEAEWNNYIESLDMLNNYEEYSSKFNGEIEKKILDLQEERRKLREYIEEKRDKGELTAEEAYKIKFKIMEIADQINNLKENSNIKTKNQILNEVLENQNIYTQKKQSEILERKGLKSYEDMVKYSKLNNIKTINTFDELKEYSFTLSQDNYLNHKSKKYGDSLENREEIQKILITLNENKDFKKVYNKVGLDILLSGEFTESKNRVGGYYKSFENHNKGVIVMNTGKSHGYNKSNYSLMNDHGRGNVGFNNAGTLIHEYGHRVDHVFRLNNISIMNEFRRRSGKNFSINDDVSRYGSTNVRESFAEMFCLTFSDVYIPEKFPKEFKIFKDLIMEKLEEIE